MSPSLSVAQAYRGAIEEMSRRTAPDGGFRPSQGLPGRADATAWATLVLRVYKQFRAMANSGRSFLARQQADNGSVPIGREHPHAFWPTSLAVLAWDGAPGFREASARAIRFLLETTGHHWKNTATDPFGHDTDLEGWSWTEGTHAWVEPTSLTVAALTAAGFSEHRRVKQAVRLLLDRQLPCGGWNYGNTTVFGRELRAAPETTGAALYALAGHASPGQIGRSAEYLRDQIRRLRTPLALGWSLLGLQAWGMGPPNPETLVIETLNRQDRYGLYDTSSLSVLLFGAILTDVSMERLEDR
jgi:hypothetical protein